MSFYISKVEGSSLLTSIGNEFTLKWLSFTVPTEKLMSDLPPPLKGLAIKPNLGFQCTNECLEGVLDFNVRSDDVYVVSVPKSGSSWMTTIAWLLTHNLNYETIQSARRENLMGDFDEYFNAKATKEKACELLANDKTKSMSELAATIQAWNEIFEPLESPRVIKAHYPPYFLPKHVWTKGARIIYVVRNPKDATVSWYHFVRNYMRFDITMDDAVNMVINDLSLTSPHLDHIQNYWKIRHLPNVCFIYYEDLVNDSVATLKKISKFLGYNYSDEQLNELANFISFKSMEKNDKINREPDLIRMEKEFGKRLDTKFK